MIWGNYCNTKDLTQFFNGWMRDNKFVLIFHYYFSSPVSVCSCFWNTLKRLCQQNASQLFNDTFSYNDLLCIFNFRFSFFCCCSYWRWRSYERFQDFGMIFIGFYNYKCMCGKSTVDFPAYNCTINM